MAVFIIHTSSLVASSIVAFKAQLAASAMPSAYLGNYSNKKAKKLKKITSSVTA
jgi:hypothetical protein